MRTYHRSPRLFHIRSLIICIALLVGGCSGMQVISVHSHPPYTALGAPRSIAVIVENASPPPNKEKRRAQQLVDAQAASDAIGVNLHKLLSSRRLMVVAADQPADLILRCRLVDVKSGSDALRLFVGYGAGKAVLRVAVSLSDARIQEISPLLGFETDGTSGNLPPGAHNIGHGLGKEIGQTIQSIDEQLGRYFAAQGWAYPAAADTAVQ